MVYISSTYLEVTTNLTKVTLSGVGWSDIWQKKYFSFFKVNYLSSCQEELSKFATL